MNIYISLVLLLCSLSFFIYKKQMTEEPYEREQGEFYVRFMPGSMQCEVFSVLDWKPFSDRISPLFPSPTPLLRQDTANHTHVNMAAWTIQDYFKELSLSRNYLAWAVLKTLGFINYKYCRYDRGTVVLSNYNGRPLTRSQVDTILRTCQCVGQEEEYDTSPKMKRSMQQ